MSKPKLKRKDHKALNALNDYLGKRSQLVLNQSVVRAATLERLERLRVLADQMKVDDSPAMSLCGHGA